MAKGKGKKKKDKGPKKRKLKAPLFSLFNMELLMTEYLDNFHKCDKESDKVEAIPKEMFGKALRMCGVMPSEKLIDLLGERIEKQQPIMTPPPSDDEWEDEEEEIVFTEEEMAIRAALLAGETATEIIKKKKKKKKRRESDEEEDEEEEAERLRLEEEQRLAEEKLREEEERQRKEEEEAAKKKKPPKRDLNWPESRKKEEIKKIAKMKLRFKRFIKWSEFVEVMWCYATDTQYTGEDILWAFRTLDPKVDYEMEPVWPYGADEPLVPTDEIDNKICAGFLIGRQERFLEKELKRFLKMADFKKEGIFSYKEMVEDYNKEANYRMGVPPKKKKIKVKET